MRNLHVTRYCEYCKQPFHPLYRRTTEKPQAFCSRECKLLSRWGEPVERHCVICGKPATSTGKRNQLYCSLACRIVNQVGKANPARSNRITKNCEWCGEPFSRPATNFHSDKAFCSYACMAEWQSEFVTGANHPRWKGGTPRSYGIGWNAARRAAFQRANGVCERCKKMPPKHVHHRLPVRYFEHIKDAHFSANLIAVCTRCHGAEHRALAKALPLLDILTVER